MLVQMEREIDREIALDKKTGEYSQGTDSNDSDYTDLSDAEDLTEIGPKAQIVNNDLKSLDEMVSVHIIMLIELLTKFLWKGIPIDFNINYQL